MNFINKIIEPDRLLLSWQLDKESEYRQRMFVAELLRTEDSADLNYLVDFEEFKQATDNGFEGYPGYPSDKNVTYNNVLSAFTKRLPPQKRKDFPRYLESLRIKENSGISDFALLGYSNAILPGDDFTIIHPFEKAEPPFELLTQIQGYRHLEEHLPYASIDENAEVTFKKEPANKFDADAIRVLLNGTPSGYICRGLHDSFHEWMDSGYQLKATVEKTNGTEKRPQVSIFIAVTK